MIKGFLKIMVLKSVKDSPKSGYELMKYIEENTGKKPSPGSIYPLMKTLNNKGFVKSKIVGKKKIYSITNPGKKRIEEIQKEQKELQERHNLLIKKINDLSGEKTNKVLACDNPDFIRNSDIFNDFKNIIESLIIKKKFKTNESKIRNILKNATKELKKI